jgi:SAM-dependent methyltransferase
MIHPEVKEFYDRHARESGMEEAGILDVSSAEEAIYRDRMEKATLRRFLPRQRFSSVLELGCGNGRWLEFFSPRADRVVGMDISLPILLHARRRLARRACSRRTELIAGDVCRLPLRTRFSLIYLSSLLLYLTDAEIVHLLSELRELLEPGGILLCRDSLSTAEHFERNDGYFAIYRESNEIQRLFHNAGFHLLDGIRTYRRLKQPFWMKKFLPPWVFRRFHLALIVFFDSFIEQLHRLTHATLARDHSMATKHLFLLYEKR